MLRATFPLFVVFTQGYPVLEVFAKRRFLPQHPLRHHPLWLEEKDFLVNQSQAINHHTTSPLQISPYEHHPTLSPYARRASRGLQAAVSTGAACGQQTCQTDPLYAVPICTIVIDRPLYFYNLEQMRLCNDHTSYQPTDTALNNSCSDGPVGGEEGNAHETSSLHEAAFPGLTPYHDERRELLRLMYPPRDINVPLSICGMNPYSAFLGKQLLHRAHMMGYRSPWWGSVSQWRRRGAQVCGNESAHIVNVPLETKLVHISLIRNAEVLIQRSYISPWTGFFSLAVDETASACAPNDEHPTERSISTEVVGSKDSESPGASSSPEKGATRPRINSHFMNCIMKDVSSHGYQVPLYFSTVFLRLHRLKLKENAVGVNAFHTNHILPISLERLTHTSLTPAPHVGWDEGDVRVPLQGGYRRSKVRSSYFYHISQLQFPSNFKLRGTVLAAEKLSPGVPLHGVTGLPLHYPELQYESILNSLTPELASLLPTPETRDHHCGAPHSQSVAFADAARADLTEEDANAFPSVSDTVVKGIVADANPELFMHGRDTQESTSVEIPREMESPCDSASSSTRRHLWFRAEDVLRYGGLVDVNATPVEVSEHTIDGDFLPKGALFNVECLVNPDEGFAIINNFANIAPTTVNREGQGPRVYGDGTDPR